MTAIAEPAPPPTRWRVLVPFALVTLIWGSTWIVIRDQLGVVPAGWSIAYRFTIASLVLFAYAAIRGETLRILRADMPFVALVGLMQFTLNFNFVYHAEHFVTSGLVAVVFALLLVPNALLARAFLGQTVSRPFLAGSGVAIVGIALLFVHEIGEAARGDVDAGARSVLLGIGLTLCGVMSASVANVMQVTDRARRLPMAAMLAWAMAIGAGADAAVAFATHGPPSFDWRAGYVAGLLYLGIAASALAFVLYFGLLRAIGAARAAYSSVLVPVIAMSLSTLFEGYRWTPTAAVGGTLALAGLVLALRSPRPARGVKMPSRGG